MSTHVNQPDGPFLAIPHVAVEGRERELRALADAARDLIDATVTTAPNAVTTSSIAARVEALTTEIDQRRGGAPIPRFSDPERRSETAHASTPFDVIHGIYNPLALPLQMSFDGLKAIGSGTFPTPYEGPPGRVHGAVIAGAFDMVMSSANRLADRGGPTANLTITYLGATAIGQPLAFEAWFDHAEGRKIFTQGRIVQDGAVTATAAALFIDLDPADIARLGVGPEA